MHFRPFSVTKKKKISNFSDFTAFLDFFIDFFFDDLLNIGLLPPS